MGDMPMGYGHFSPEADSASTMPINQSDCLQPRGDVQLIRENGHFAMDMESSEQKLSLFASGELVMHSVAAEYSRRSQSTVIPRPSSLPSLPSLPADAVLQWQLVPYNPCRSSPQLVKTALSCRTAVDSKSSTRRSILIRMQCRCDSGGSPILFFDS